MAIYHLSVKAIQRSKGRSATAAAAYRAGEVVTCEREGRQHDYTLKRGVAHAQIIGWNGSREELWNSAEAAERQKNATVAKEHEIALPVELTPDEQIALAARFGQWLHDRHGVAVDIACHDLHSPNPHSHIMTTTRPVTEDGTLAPVKAEVEWADKKRKQHGLPGRKTELDAARREWETMANAALAESGAKARIDHRSLKEQGIDRPPQVHEGPTVRKIEAEAEAEAEQRGVEYQPVTIKGQMNADTRVIGRIQLDLDAMRAERDAEIEAEAEAEAEQEQAQQARESAHAANRSEAGAEAEDAAKSAHSDEQAVVYQSPAVSQVAAAYRRAQNPADRARLAHRVAAVIEQQTPERPQLPPRGEVEADEKPKVPVNIRQKNGRVIETTQQQAGRWYEKAEKSRHRAEREVELAARAKSWWRPGTWRMERSAKRNLDRAKIEFDRAHDRLIAVDKGLRQPGARAQVSDRVGAVMSSLRDEQRSFDRKWQGHTGESAAWRETARTHESEQREQQMEQGPKHRPGPKNGPDLGL